MKVYEFKQDRIGSRSIIHKNGNNMYNLGDILTNTLITDTFELYTGAKAANTTNTLTYNISKNGYTPIGVIGLKCSGSYSSFLRLYQWYVSGNNANVMYRNVASNSLTANDTKISVSIIYIKNSLT